MKWLIKESQKFQGFTALHVAAEFNQVEIAELLIEKGTDVNTKSVNLFNPWS